MVSKLITRILSSRQYNLFNRYNNFVKSRMMSTQTVTSSEFPTLSELKYCMTKDMGVDVYQPIPKDRSHLLKYLPKTQNELPKRSMKDSFLVGIIPLSSDKFLQDKYTTFLGQVRIGRLLEDMDIFAVMVGHKHIVNPNQSGTENFPYTLVTALVDKIDFTDFIPKPAEDIKISGHVSWVGRSSLEVVVWLDQKMHGTWHRITRALFLIAARDSLNEKSASVNAIEPADEREKEILSGGEERKRRRMFMQQKHVSKLIPDGEEQQIIHNLYIRTTDKDNSLRNRVLPPGCVWMSTATISNTIFSHPDERNMHNTVFGGFIMRMAEELAWVLGFTFSKYRPVLKSISDISFQKPIAVSSLIRMHAHVVYTQLNWIQILVYVEVYNSVTGDNDTTNTLHFTFQVPELVHECIPQTYHEAMMYIDGRRHFLEVTQKPNSFPSKL
ncbi:acyl-coenzyme A thioesterase 9, mitochondrial-like isoform X2 [Diabrotica undecimpunctata]|uniref:acyl-coenzyme A thioesterase 9, mitochondrial-like isoform X2 n=1 Tax=Diabrotica undecimpunctata TaxID=50387 RepID=UPI003B641BAD